jgi:hypothetical protein
LIERVKSELESQQRRRAEFVIVSGNTYRGTSAHITEEGIETPLCSFIVDSYATLRSRPDGGSGDLVSGDVGIGVGIDVDQDRRVGGRVAARELNGGTGGSRATTGDGELGTFCNGVLEWRGRRWKNGYGTCVELRLVAGVDGEEFVTEHIVAC